MFSGKQALNLILHSDRIFSDFILGVLENGENFLPNLIIREFESNLDFECEFRCFIYRGHLTAITQYNSMSYRI